MTTTKKRATIEDRFWDKVLKLENGCWQWAATKNNLGYGQFWNGTKNVLAHRFSLGLHNITIPLGLECDHKCHNRSCVNPSHIELVKHSENISRGIGVGKVELQKTHCPYGHPYDSQNTYITTEGHRFCIACRNRRNRDYRRKLKSKFEEKE